MARTTRIAREKRGIFGIIAMTLFLAFNFFMAYMTWAGVSTSVDLYGQQPDTMSQAGTAIGSGLAVGIILFIWLFGAIILGLFALLTRGKTVIVEEDSSV